MFQYGTYVAFSWDIIEPITACVSLTDAIAGYYFWMWAGKPWDLDSLRSFFYDRALQKKKFKSRHEEYHELLKFREKVLK